MEIAAASRSFESLNLSAETLAALDAKGYRQPTDVQAETIPRAQAGKDLVVQSRTGTGKTAAFGIPIAEKVDPAVDVVQAVALTPTRELAMQVAQELEEIGRGARHPGRLHLRRRSHGAPAGGHPRGRPRDRGHARPRAGPPAAAHAEVRRREDAGAGRGRPHARHGLRGRDGPDHGVRGPGAADAAVLGHGPAGHPRAHLPLPERARVGPAVRGPDLRQGSRAHVLPDSAHAQGGHALQDAGVREPRVLHDLLQHARGDAARLYLPGGEGPGLGHAVLRPAAEEARARDGAVPQRPGPAPGDDRRRLARHRRGRPLARVHLLHSGLAGAVHPPRRPHRARGQERPRHQPHLRARPHELQPAGQALPRRSEGDDGPLRDGGPGAQGGAHRHPAGRRGPDAAPRGLRRVHAHRAARGRARAPRPHRGPAAAAQLRAAAAGGRRRRRAEGHERRAAAPGRGNGGGGIRRRRRR